MPRRVLGHTNKTGGASTELSKRARVEVPDCSGMSGRLRLLRILYCAPFGRTAEMVLARGPAPRPVPEIRTHYHALNRGEVNSVP